MKPKISPEEYRNILDALELDTLYLNECNSKYREDMVSSSLNLEIDEKNSFEQNSNILKVYYTYKLSAKDPEKEDAAIYLQAKYTVRYTVNKEIVISKEFMKIFSDLSLSMLLWTYFRELVNNSVYRMGMPPLVLPLKKK